MRPTSLKLGTLYLTVASGIFIISSYVVNIWLGRSFGPEAFGVYGIIISLMTTVNLLQTNGLPQALSRLLAEEKIDKKSLYKSAFLLQVALTLILTLLYFALAKPIASLLGDTSLVAYLQLSSLILPGYGIYALTLGRLNGSLLFKQQAVVQSLYSIFKVSLIIFFAREFILTGALLGFALAPLLAGLINFKLPDFRVKAYPYSNLLKLSSPLIAFSVLSIMQYSIDILFVKALTGSDYNAGIMSASQNIARIPFFAFSSVILVLFPAIAKSFNTKTNQQTAQLIEKALRATSVLLLPTIFILASTSSELLSIIFSPEYAQGATVLTILLFAMGCFTYFSVISTILNGAGHTANPLRAAGLSLLITTAVSFILIPAIGAIGGAIATLAGICLALIVSYIDLTKKFAIRLNSKDVLAQIGIALCLLILTKLPFGTGVANIIAKYTLYFGLFFGINYSTGLIPKEDIAFLKVFMKRKAQKYP